MLSVPGVNSIRAPDHCIGSIWSAVALGIFDLSRETVASPWKLIFFNHPQTVSTAPVSSYMRSQLYSRCWLPIF